MAYECRMHDALTGTDTQTPGLTTCDLQHRERGFVAANDVERMRRCVLDDLLNAAARVDENHIERDVGVLHPHVDWLRLLVHEQHAAQIRQRAHEHEALRLSRRRVSQPDLEHVFDLVAIADLELVARECGEIFDRARLGASRRTDDEYDDAKRAQRAAQRIIFSWVLLHDGHRLRIPRGLQSRNW